MRVLNASGCLDALTAPEVAGALDVFVTKTVTPLPREGNAAPRIAEVEHGMLNSIGLANPGIDHFLSQALPRLAELRVPIWVSVGGFAASEYADLCDRLDDRPEVAAIELNVSCPNVDDVPSSVGEIVAAARDATRKLLYTKLSPATTDIAEVARAAQAAGTDGLSLVNTILGLALDERTLKPRLSRAARELLARAALLLPHARAGNGDRVRFVDKLAPALVRDRHVELETVIPALLQRRPGLLPRGVGDRADVHLSAIVVSIEDSKTAGAASGSRRGIAGTTRGGLAASGRLSRED